MVRHYRQTKPIWKSRTLWFNNALLVLALAGAIPAALTTIVLIGVLVANCLLRFATSQPVSIDGQPRLSKSRLPFIVRSDMVEVQRPVAVWNGKIWTKDERPEDG